ncbi:MAG: hypothetical protein IPK52_25315 [Chloroflexi bacterium]|nr:hypothetical protein [Chloroflexota bacterium]
MTGDLVSWSPDGAQIAVAGTLDLVIYTPELEVVTSSLLDAAANAVSWLPDGSLVLMTRANRDDTATTVYSAIVYVLSDSGQLTVRRTFESDTSVTITPILDHHRLASCRRMAGQCTTRTSPSALVSPT